MPNMKRWSDAKLNKELAFSKAFQLDDDAAVKWHAALVSEKQRRSAKN